MKIVDIQTIVREPETVYTVELFNNHPGGGDEGVVLGDEIYTVFHRPLTMGELLIVDQMEPQGEDENPVVFAHRALRVTDAYHTNVLGVVYDLEYVCSDDKQYVKMVGKIKLDKRLKKEQVQHLQLRILSQSAPTRRLLKVICLELPTKYKEVA